MNGKEKERDVPAAGHDESRTGEEISGERCGRLFGYIRKSRGKVFQKNPLFMAKNLMLKGEDEAAVRLLENDTEKLPYYEVTRIFCREYVTTESEKKSREKNVWNM